MIDDWRDLADCAGRTEPDPSLPGIRVNKRRDIARWYCLECTVIRECALDARRRGDVGVIRGGLYLYAKANGQSAATRRALAHVIETGEP